MPFVPGDTYVQCGAEDFEIDYTGGWMFSGKKICPGMWFQCWEVYHVTPCSISAKLMKTYFIMNKFQPTKNPLFVIVQKRIRNKTFRPKLVPGSYPVGSPKTGVFDHMACFSSLKLSQAFEVEQLAFIEYDILKNSFMRYLPSPPDENGIR